MPIDEITGDNIDRAVSVEMRFGGGLPRGVTTPLYDAGREAAGGSMTWRAAKALTERVKKGDHVLVVTGAGTPPGLPKGETDGPMGAAAVARAVTLGLGAKPVMVGEERNMPSTIECTEAAGLMVVDDELFSQRGGVALAVNFPLGAEAGKKAAADLLARFKPTAIVFVEKGGPNEKGVFHSIMGTGRPDTDMANAHLLAEMAMEQGVLTIGIGDGGNEIGCGNIIEAVWKVQPYGRKCQCPCGAGVATVAKCDHLIFCAVSNWGGYALAAALGGLLDKPSLLHDVEMEHQLLYASLRGGALDGAYATLIPYVDGTNAAVQTSIVTILHQIVENGLMTHDRGF